MGKKYNNPPIVEALCEFQFIPSQPWDMTVPGLLYEKIPDWIENAHTVVEGAFESSITDKCRSLFGEIS